MSELWEYSSPLLSDWFGNVGRLYGVWSEEKQREMRAIFIVDPAGVVFFKGTYGDDEMPDIESVLDALRDLYRQEQELAG